MKRGVQRLGDVVRRCCFWAVFGGISACGTLDVQPFLREQITGDTHRACLAREYQRLAKIVVRDSRNWGEATRLATKGRVALEGTKVDLEDGAPAILSTPTCACATAQARFDAAAKDFDESLRTCETSVTPQ